MTLVSSIVLDVELVAFRLFNDITVTDIKMS